MNDIISLIRTLKTPADRLQMVQQLLDKLKVRFRIRVTVRTRVSISFRVRVRVRTRVRMKIRLRIRVKVRIKSRVKVRVRHSVTVRALFQSRLLSNYLINYRQNLILALIRNPNTEPQHVS